MTEEITTHPATGFDIETWLQDAAMPQESADVYKRADVVGELSALQRQIEVYREAAADPERSAADGTSGTLAELEAEYDKLVDTFTGSLLTIYTRALSPDEKRELREANEKVHPDNPVKQNEEYGHALLAASIVAVRPFGGERTPVTWTAQQVRSMERAIGSVQMKQVLAAHQTAQNTLPDVDADFLHRPSGEGVGQE